MERGTIDESREVNLMEAMQQEKIYTIEDIYALPEGERAELIDGQIYYMEAPSLIHQRMLGKLHQIIANYIDSHGENVKRYRLPLQCF